jgi:hypothetical protein
MSLIGNLEKSTAVTDFETYLPAFANVLGGIISKDEKLVSALGRESLDLGKVVVEKWDAPERKRSLSSKTEAEQKQRKTLNPKEYQQGYESWLRNPQTKRDLQARNITLNNLQPGQEDIVKDMYGEHFKTEQLGDVAERRRSMWDWFFEMLLNGFTSDMRSKLRIPANI